MNDEELEELINEYRREAESLKKEMDKHTKTIHTYMFVAGVHITVLVISMFM